jgi:hypothetical protein
VCHRSAKASGGKALESEQPISCWDGASLDFHTALPSMRGAPSQKRRLIPLGMMAAFHPAYLPVASVRRLIQQRAGHGHRGSFAHGLPAGLLVPPPAPAACAVHGSRRGGDMVCKVPQSLAGRKHPPAPAPSRLVEEGMALGAPGLTDRRRDRRPFPRELEERVAKAMAQACPWQQRPQALARAIEAIAAHPLDPVRRLLRGCHAWKRAIRAAKGRCPGVLRRAQRPEHTTTDHRGQVHFVSQPMAVLLIGPEIPWQRQSAPGAHCDQTLGAARPEQAIERHRGDRPAHRTELSTEAPMRGSPRVTGPVRTQVAIAQDAVGEPCEDRLARGALDAPNSEITQPDTRIMRMAW